MSSVSVDPNLVVPMQSVMVVMGVVGIVLFVFLLKNSLSSIPCSEEKTLSSVQSQDSPEPTCGMFHSPVHAFATLFFCFFMVFMITMQFVSSWITKQQCFYVKLFNQTAWTGAKASQYSFFITRMYYVFRESTLAVPNHVLKLLIGVVVFFFISHMGSGFFIIFRTGGVNGGDFVAGKNASGKVLYVCNYGNSEEFDPGVAWAGLNYVICDTIIMVSVVYGFVSRLLKMATFASRDRQILKTVKAAYRALALFLFSAWSSLVTVLIINVYPNNMSGYVVPFFDFLLNGVAIFAVFKFGDFVYDHACIVCNPCAGFCILCCCGRNNTKIREILASADVNHSSSARHLRSVPSATLSASPGKFTSSLTQTSSVSPASPTSQV